MPQQMEDTLVYKYLQVQFYRNLLRLNKNNDNNLRRWHNCPLILHI